MSLQSTTKLMLKNIASKFGVAPIGLKYLKQILTINAELIIKEQKYENLRNKLANLSEKGLTFYYDQNHGPSFELNKGKLPWPVAEGVITSTFGEHEHPVLKNIKIKNNGVDITTTRNAMARSVFDGEISGVISIPDAGQAIIVRHGDYLSVYSNLKEVYVKKGDKVKTKQSIASVDIDNESGKVEVHLEIWKGNVMLNPELWLKRGN